LYWFVRHLAEPKLRKGLGRSFSFDSDSIDNYHKTFKFKYRFLSYKIFKNY